MDPKAKEILLGVKEGAETPVTHLLLSGADVPRLREVAEIVLGT